MDTLGQRVKKVIVYHGETMTSFAKALNISQSMVSKICSDKATPSDRTISDICRIYNIRKDWLLSENGQMQDKQSLENELRQSFDGCTTLSNTIKENMISALINTPPAAWPLIVDYLQSIADEYDKNPTISGTYQEGYMEGYMAGVRLEQKIIKKIETLSDEPEE